MERHFWGGLFVISLILAISGYNLVFAEALKSDAQLSSEFSHQVELYRSAKDTEEEIAAIEAALALEARIKVWPFTQPREIFRGPLLGQLGLAYQSRQGDAAENFEKAIKALEAALVIFDRKKAPQDWAKTESNLALALDGRIRGDKADNIERAIKACELSLNVYTRENYRHDWAVQQNLLGMLYIHRIKGEQLENLGRAINALERARAIFSSDRAGDYEGDSKTLLIGAYITRAELYKSKNDFRAAIADFTQVIGIQPTSTAAYKERGAASQAIGNQAQAIRDFTKLIELNPKDSEPYARRAWSLLQSRNAQDALADANQSLSSRPDDAQTLNTRAHIFEVLNRREDAVADYRRVLALALETQSALRTDSSDALKRLGAAVSAAPAPEGREFYGPSGKLDRPEPQFRAISALMDARAAVKEAVEQFGEGSVEYATALSGLAVVLRDANRLSDAESTVRSALAIHEKKLGPASRNVAKDLNTLAMVLLDNNQPVESERLLRRALVIDEELSGPQSTDVALDLHNLAGVLGETNRLTEAEPLLRRAISIEEKLLPSDDPSFGAELNNLAVLLQDTKRLTEAEPLMRRALANFEKNFGPDGIELSASLSNLALLLADTHRPADAEKMLRRAVEIETAYGQSPQLANDISNWAVILETNHNLSESQAQMRRALEMAEGFLVPNHPRLVTMHANLAVSLGEAGKWPEAVEQIRQATDIVIKRVDDNQEVRAGLTKRLIASNSLLFRYYVIALHQATANAPAARDESFRSAQWALQTDAADALRQMSLRLTSDQSRLADLVREQQDLLRDRMQADTRFFSAVGHAEGNVAEEQRVAYATIDTRLDAIAAQLGREFPQYSALARPSVLSIKELQSLIGPDEALVQFLDVPATFGSQEGTFIWVVTSAETRWVRSDLGPSALTREVAAVRCGLDYAGRWFDDKGKWDGSRCNDLLKVAYTKADHDVLRKPLPFDLIRAAKLYKGLFGQIEDVIKDRSLLIVPSGPLTQLPFQVLVTELGKSALSDTEYKDVAWLVRKHAITVLPAVSSLKALRELAKESHATEPYIGFGNPLLDGEPEKFKEDGPAAKLAREKRCEPTLRQRVASLFGLRGGTRAMTRSSGGVADVADLRSWAPLPETADELCDVAHDLGVDPKTHLYLGATATEIKIKQLSEEGSLAKYKIVHFATHGVVAGEVSGTSEPGLLLTPPVKASETDDGYLSASEIAGLKLDADWVILSACNTAAGDTKGAEALSGLARAFFYAGARSLLVSHWEVASDATVKLITKAIAELKADPKIGRSEALRRSMLSMITTGKDYEAHPAFWAPFVLVGEGGAAR